MEFTNRHNQRPMPSAKPSSHPARAPRSVRTSPPTIKQAVKASGKMINVAFSHATKAVIREGKDLFKLTEEEFGLDENPRWQKLRSRLRRITRRFKLPVKIYIILGSIIIAGLIFLAIYQRPTTPQTKPKSYTSAKLEKGTPSYPTVLPEGKTIESLGGWTRVSPSTASPVYAFSDTVDGIGVIVSEQPLPDALKKPGAIEEFTKAYSADHKVTVDGIDVYIGTSAKGPQSAILTTNNLLILVKTDDKLTDAQWANYVGSFH